MTGTRSDTIVLSRAYRALTGEFLLLRIFSVAISMSPHACFYYAPVTIVRGHYDLPLSVRPSVRHALRFVQSTPPTVLMDLFETLYTCCGHIEDVHVGFWWS